MLRRRRRVQDSKDTEPVQRNDDQDVETALATAASEGGPDAATSSTTDGDSTPGSVPVSAVENANQIPQIKGRRVLEANEGEPQSIDIDLGEMRASQDKLRITMGGMGVLIKTKPSRATVEVFYNDLNNLDDSAIDSTYFPLDAGKIKVMGTEPNTYDFREGFGFEKRKLDVDTFATNVRARNTEVSSRNPELLAGLAAKHVMIAHDPKTEVLRITNLSNDPLILDRILKDTPSPDDE